MKIFYEHSYKEHQNMFLDIKSNLKENNQPKFVRFFHLWKKNGTNCLAKFHIWKKTNSTKILRFCFIWKKDESIDDRINITSYVKTFMLFVHVNVWRVFSSYIFIFLIMCFSFFSLSKVRSLRHKNIFSKDISFFLAY